MAPEQRAFFGQPALRLDGARLRALAACARNRRGARAFTPHAAENAGPSVGLPHALAPLE
jgi:hypothetical protein